MPPTNAPDDSAYVEEGLRSTDAEFLVALTEDYSDVFSPYELKRLEEISGKVSLIEGFVTEVTDPRLSPEEQRQANEILQPRDAPPRNEEMTDATVPAEDGRVTFPQPKVEPERNGGFAQEIFPDKAPG